MLFNENTKIRLGYLGTMNGKGMYENARMNSDVIIALFKGNTPDDTRYINTKAAFFKVNDDVFSYYFFERENGVDIFMELPLVKNDELFKWVRRDIRCVKMLWTRLKKGKLIYNCSYHLSSHRVQVRIIWEKQLLHTTWIENATNEDILNVINEWNAEFEGGVWYAIERAELEDSNELA